jgi:hypothetical protein
MTTQQKAFRKLILKGFGKITGNFDFQSTRIRIGEQSIPVWNVRTQDLIRYMISKGGDFANIHSVENIRRVVRAEQQKPVPRPKRKASSGYYRAYA